ncbi:MAG: transcription antitermination factor NusB [bacterium]
MKNHDEFTLARHGALLVLCGLDISGGSVAEALRDYPSSLADEETLEGKSAEVRKSWPQIQERVLGVHEQLDALNDEIRSVSPRWKIERMAPVDRSILRLGIWDILFNQCLPLAVINDCVELAKSYGEKGTPAFVNGLLDQVCQNHGIAIK